MDAMDVLNMSPKCFLLYQKEAPLNFKHLQLVGFLELVGIFILAIVALLGLDGRVYPLFFNLGSGQVEVGIGLLVQVQRSL